MKYNKCMCVEIMLTMKIWNHGIEDCFCLGSLKFSQRPTRAYQNIDEWKVFALNFDFGGALL